VETNAELKVVQFEICLMEELGKIVTVEPPNIGHFGSRGFVLFSEVVLWWEVQANIQFIAPSRPNIPRWHILKLRSRLLH